MSESNRTPPSRWSFSIPRFSRGWLWRLLIELVVVFVGVYAAFALSQHGDRREAESRKQQIQQALAREIVDITGNTRRVAETLPGMLVRFDSLVAAGDRPMLTPWIEPVRVHTHMWEATLQSETLDLLDVELLYDLSRFYNELNAGFEQLHQLRALSETMVIPNLDRGADAFYEPTAGALRPGYHWYREGLGRLAWLASNITVLGDSLIVALATADGRR